MKKSKLIILVIALGIAIIFYFIPFIFGQLISPFITLIGLAIVLKRNNLDKFILIITVLILYRYSLQLFYLEMNKADNLIDLSVNIPSTQFIHSMGVFIACYVIGFSLKTENRLKNKDKR
jgi:hypothetical protein